MSQEISWYLRFSKAESLEVLIQEKAVGQAENARRIEPQWELRLEAMGAGAVRALFTRKA